MNSSRQWVGWFSVYFSCWQPLLKRLPTIAFIGGSVSEIKFSWLRNTFDALRKTGEITSTETGVLEGLAEGSHLLALLTKAGLVTVSKVANVRAKSVKKTDKFGKLKNHELIELLIREVPIMSQITTHTKKRISVILEWRNASVYYKSTNRIATDSLQEIPNFDNQRDRRSSTADRLVRVGQREFSDRINENYGGKCAITGCITPAALQAAHVKTFPGEGKDDHSSNNGILLRADIHALFDRFLVTFSEDGLGLTVSLKLADSSYKFLKSAAVRKPQTGAVSKANRLAHRAKFLEKQPTLNTDFDASYQLLTDG